MCELHRQKCVGCKLVYTTHAKLPGCESDDPNAICRRSLCVHVGNPKKPTWSECPACRDDREKREQEEEEEQERWWEERRARRLEEQRQERQKNEESRGESSTS